MSFFYTDTAVCQWHKHPNTHIWTRFSLTYKYKRREWNRLSETALLRTLSSTLTACTSTAWIHPRLFLLPACFSYSFFSLYYQGTHMQFIWLSFFLDFFAKQWTGRKDTFQGLKMAPKREPSIKKSPSGGTLPRHGPPFPCPATTPSPPKPELKPRMLRPSDSPFDPSTLEVSDGPATEHLEFEISPAYSSLLWQQLFYASLK